MQDIKEKRNQLLEYKKKLEELNKEDKVKRDLYLKKINLFSLLLLLRVFRL